jgi:hypothetical protein
LSLWLLAAAEAGAQVSDWDPGDRCILNKTLRMSAKTENRGRKTRLRTDTLLTVAAVEGSWVLVEVGRKRGYLPLAKIDASCMALTPATPEQTTAAGDASIEASQVVPPAPAPTSPAPIAAAPQPAPGPGSETTEILADAPAPTADSWAPEVEDVDRPQHDDARQADGAGELHFDLLGGGGLGLSRGAGKPVFDTNLGIGWQMFPRFSVGLRLVFHGVPEVAGTGYGFGGGGLALRFELPLGSALEPYTLLFSGAGFGGAGSAGFVGIGRVALGGRLFVTDLVCVAAEVAAVASQVSVAGIAAVGVGLSL